MLSIDNSYVFRKLVVTRSVFRKDDIENDCVEHNEYL